MKVIEIPKHHVFTAVCVNGKTVDSLKPIKVKVDDYWVIVDKSNRLKSNYYYDIKYNVILNNSFINSSNGDIAYIIASTKFIDKSIPVVKFVEQSVEEIALTLYPIELHNSIDINKQKRENFVKYNKFSKSYTEEDLFKAFRFYAFSSTSQQPYNEKELEEEFNKFIQSLNQPKLPDVINLEIDGGKLRTKPTPEGEVIEVKI
jgi:hypothetical protein